MNEETFLTLARNINSIDSALIISSLNAAEYSDLKSLLNGTLAAAAYARADYAEFCEDGEAL